MLMLLFTLLKFSEICSSGPNYNSLALLVYLIGLLYTIKTCTLPNWHKTWPVHALLCFISLMIAQKYGAAYFVAIIIYVLLHAHYSAQESDNSSASNNHNSNDSNIITKNCNSSDSNVIAKNYNSSGSSITTKNCNSSDSNVTANNHNLSNSNISKCALIKTKIMFILKFIIALSLLVLAFIAYEFYTGNLPYFIDLTLCGMSSFMNNFSFALGFLLLIFVIIFAIITSAFFIKRKLDGYQYVQAMLGFVIGILLVLIPLINPYHLEIVWLVAIIFITYVVIHSTESLLANKIIENIFEIMIATLALLLLVKAAATFCYWKDNHITDKNSLFYGGTLSTDIQEKLAEISQYLDKLNTRDNHHNQLDESPEEYSEIESDINNKEYDELDNNDNEYYVISEFSYYFTLYNVPQKDNWFFDLALCGNLGSKDYDLLVEKIDNSEPGTYFIVSELDISTQFYGNELLSVFQEGCENGLYEKIKSFDGIETDKKVYVFLKKQRWLRHPFLYLFALYYKSLLSKICTCY